MSLQDLLIFSAISAALALVTHALIRHYWLAVMIAAMGASFINVCHEAWSHELTVRPADAFFWIPMLLMLGLGAAFPAAALTGIPFYLFRRRKKPL